MASILFISPGYVPPSDDERESSLFYLTEQHEGDVIQPVWGARGPSPLKHQVRRFSYHVTYSYRLPPPIRLAWELLFYIGKGLSLHRSRPRKYDVIVCYGWSKTGVAALVLKWLTGAKLIVELPGTPKAAQLFLSSRLTPLSRIKSELNGWLLKFILKRADGVKMLSPNQADGFLPNRKIQTAVYHDLVPVNSLEPVDVDEKYVLLVGYPWYLKGVDVLIKAFKQIVDEFPEHRLRIVGHCPNRSIFEQLRDGDERIEFFPGVKHDEAIRHISRCSVFALASRTEAMGRVLLEAMALRKPIIASRVDGIPHYINHGQNGLLFESENVDELAESLRRVLADSALAQRLSENGYQMVHEIYSEKCFADAFDDLIEATIGFQESKEFLMHADS